MLRNAAPEREQRYERAHDDGTADILEQGCMRKCRAEHARESEIEAVAQRGADATTNKYDQEAHRPDLLCLRAWKNRPAADRFLPPCCTAGVISPKIS